ncbi:MAG: hypothetical protein R3E79_52125 [Caldilineaceae bacterium]
MRFLRFLALLLVVTIAYSAQFVLHPPPLSSSDLLLPPQVYALLPDLSPLRALLTGDIRDVAFFLTALAAVSFGLLTAPWSLTEPALAATSTAAGTSRPRSRQAVGWLLVLCALVLAMAASLLFRVQIATGSNAPAATYGQALLTWLPSLPAFLLQAPWLAEFLWVVGLLSFFVGCAFFPRRLVQDAAHPSSIAASAVKAPTASWPLLLLLLLAAGLLYGWRLTQIPLWVEPGVAQVGLLASDWLHKGQTSLFLMGPELEPGLHISWLATAVTALFFWLTDDLLLSVRLTGLLAALLTIGATWLLGTELFRRIPRRLAIEPGEDQGAWPTLLATLLVMLTVATLLFSRFPVLLEMVAWGNLGCWALVRGLRTDDRLAVGLSGVLIGFSAILYTPGFVFCLTAIFWWVGYGFLQSGWLPHRLRSPLSTAYLRGYFSLWLIGLALTLGVGYVSTGQGAPSLQGNLLTHWQPALLAFGQQQDLSQLGGLTIPLLHDLLAPFLFLAIGALWFNLDRRVGWMLLTWLGSGLVYAMILPATVPNWPALLPILPAVGLVLAFGINQFQLTLFQSAGSWIRNLVNYLVMGLILWVGLNNVVTYYHFAQQQADPISALGHELRTMPAGQPVLVIAAPAISDTLQLRFLTNDWQRPPRSTVTFRETLPDDLPAGTVILVTPPNPAALFVLQASTAGDATIFVRRDHLANPLLYRYMVPNAP